MPLLLVYFDKRAVTKINQHGDPQEYDGAEVLHFDRVEDVIAALTAVPDGYVLSLIDNLEARATSANSSYRRATVLFITTSLCNIDVFVRTAVGVIIVASAG
jgi:hypothetical protein